LILNFMETFKKCTRFIYNWLKKRKKIEIKL